MRNLPEAKERIKLVIQDANGHMALLERYQSRLPEEEIQRTLLSFSEPLKISDHEMETRERLEGLEKEFLV